jgi:hypothetical protein
MSIILASLLAADLLWWRRADTRARKWRHALRWRLLIGLFMGGQIALVLWFLDGRIAAASFLDRPPQLLSSAAFLWHLLVLPACWALAAASGVLFGAWWWGRLLAGWTAPCRLTATSTAAPVPLPPAAPVLTVGTGESATRRQFLGMLTTVTPAPGWSTPGCN